LSRANKSTNGLFIKNASRKSAGLQKGISLIKQHKAPQEIFFSALNEEIKLSIYVCVRASLQLFIQIAAGTNILRTHRCHTILR
jgi:hypothetical protein